MAWKCKTSTHGAERRETRRREREALDEARPAVTCRGCRGAGCADCEYTGEPSLEDLLHFRGRRLYEARRASGLSVTQFCEVSGLTRTQLFAAEAGQFDASEALGRLAQGR